MKQGITVNFGSEKFRFRMQQNLARASEKQCLLCQEKRRYGAERIFINTLKCNKLVRNGGGIGRI